VRVSKQGRPIESTLQNLPGGLLNTEMASTSMIMTKGDDIRLLMLRNTPPNDLIRTILEQVRIIPKKKNALPRPKTWTYLVAPM
jgi:hypothetical protein